MKKNPHAPLTIATRGSMLALWQANFIKDWLTKEGFAATLKTYQTLGDKVQNRFLHEFGGKGAFVRELETALIQGEADIAVHSLKDLPIRTPENCELVCFLPREHPGDMIIFNPKKNVSFQNEVIDKKTLHELGPLHIATGSLRRKSLLEDASGLIKVTPIRGNVDTRLKKLEEFSFDAIILAEASVRRLNLAPHHTKHILDPHWFIPSASQGVIAIEIRADHPLRPWLREKSDKEAELFVTIERLVLESMGGDCNLPIGVHSFKRDGKLHIKTVVLDLKGSEARAEVFYEENEAPSLEKIANDVIKSLRLEGVEEILKTLQLKAPFMEK